MLFCSITLTSIRELSDILPNYNSEKIHLNRGGFLMKNTILWLMLDFFDYV